MMNATTTIEINEIASKIDIQNGNFFLLNNTILNKNKLSNMVDENDYNRNILHKIK